MNFLFILPFFVLCDIVKLTCIMIIHYDASAGDLLRNLQLGKHFPNSLHYALFCLEDTVLS